MKDRFIFSLWMLLLMASLFAFVIVLPVWIFTGFSLTDYSFSKSVAIAEKIKNKEKLKSSFERLTLLQLAVGYKAGTINPIAILGLYGEAGEVLAETFFTSTMRTEAELIGSPERVRKTAVDVARTIDMMKKLIRDDKENKMEVVVNIPINRNFDIEVADALYYLNAIAIGRGMTLADYAEISYQKVSAKTQIKID